MRILTLRAKKSLHECIVTNIAVGIYSEQKPFGKRITSPSISLE